MSKLFTEKIDKSVIIESPKDEVLTGVIIQIERGLLSEFVAPEVHSKFDNLDQETLNFTIECTFNGKKFKVNDRIAYYTEPMSNSKLAKFLEKYDTLEVSKQIKVIFDGNGFGKIKLD